MLLFLSPQLLVIQFCYYHFLILLLGSMESNMTSTPSFIYFLTGVIPDDDDNDDDDKFFRQYIKGITSTISRTSTMFSVLQRQVFHLLIVL